MPTLSSTPRRTTQLRDGSAQAIDDQLVIEEPVEIRIGGEPLAVTMRTPGHDRELAAGFCLTEGIIERADELESVEPCKLADYGNIVTVTLTEEAMQRRAACIAKGRRELYLSSSCGLCGKQSIDRLRQKTPQIEGDFTISPKVLAALPQRMREAQSTFEATGGLHAAALFTAGGELVLLREDVGRHNAEDKAIGAALLAGMLPLSHHVLLVSGRASFEIVQKAAMAALPVIAAVSAPSSLAVDTCRELGITLVGFLRPGRMNIYHDAGRMVQGAPTP